MQPGFMMVDPKEWAIRSSDSKDSVPICIVESFVELELSAQLCSDENSDGTTIFVVCGSLAYSVDSHGNVLLQNGNDYYGEEFKLHDKNRESP